MVATVVSIVAISLPINALPAQADNTRSQEWYLQTLQISAAHKISTGSGITVAVADSGVYPHPDLRNNLLPGTDVRAGMSGNGQKVGDGHGTEMASLIAAHGRPNGAGVLGIAPSSKILPIVDADSQGRGGADYMATAIEYGADQGARIINVSQGVGPSNALLDAISAAQTQDVLVVAAAGNDSTALNEYPAAAPGVLAVGASTQAGKPADFSFANANVQICAPGVKAPAAEPKNKYVIIDGTSGATAIVSGAAALIRAKFPQLSAPDVIHRLTATATPIGAAGTKDSKCGYGVLNIVKALTADVPPLDGTTTAPTADATTSPPTSVPAGASPDSEGSGANVPAIVGGVVGVLTVGGLLALLVVRRRRGSDRPRSGGA
jgi:type VII secretion-associated serine protease mycosin